MAYHFEGATYIIPGTDFEFSKPFEAIEAAKPDGNVYQINPTTGKKILFWKWKKKTKPNK